MNGLVDIKLLGTQVLGFLIFIGILRRFAWGPVVAQLEARRQRIAGEFAEAERRQKEADALKAKYEQDLRGIDAQAREKLKEAVAEGQKVASEIRSQAQKEAQDRLARAEDEIARQSEKAKEILKEKVIDLSIVTAEKILKAKLDDPAQRKLAGQFIDEVGALK
ncbi:MAG: F0F1 ATP synthase subunit B [bacterium]